MSRGEIENDECKKRFGLRRFIRLPSLQFAKERKSPSLACTEKKLGDVKKYAPKAAHQRIQRDQEKTTKMSLGS